MFLLFCLLIDVLFFFSLFFFFLNFMLRHQHGDLTSVINQKGCLMAGEEWLQTNLIVVAGVAVGIAFLQVCAQNTFTT